LIRTERAIHSAIAESRPIRPGQSVGGHLLRPKSMSELRERLAVEIGDIVETAIDRGHFIFSQVQGYLLFPKLIEGKIIACLRFLSQEHLHLIETCSVHPGDAALIAVMAPMQYFSDSVHRQLNLDHLAHRVLLNKSDSVPQTPARFQSRR